MWEFLQKLKQLQPESKNIVLTGLTGEAFGEKALVSNGKLVWASVAGGFLEQHDQQIEQLEVNGIALVDGEKIFGEVIGGQKKIVICGGGHVSMPIIQLGRQIGCYVQYWKTDRNLQITPEEQEQTKLFVIHLKRDWNRFPVIQIHFL